LSSKNGPPPEASKADLPVLFEIGSPGLWAASLPESDVPAVRRTTAVPAELLA
jgi:hypothetical protein